MIASPRSQAKAKKQHYLVKDKWWGYLCTLCGNNGNDPQDIKVKPCYPLPDVGELRATPSKHVSEEEQQTIEELRKEKLVLEALMREADEEMARNLEFEELKRIQEELLREEISLEQALAESAREAERRLAEEPEALASEVDSLLQQAAETMQDAEVVAAEAVNAPAVRPVLEGF